MSEITVFENRIAYKTRHTRNVFRNLLAGLLVVDAHGAGHRPASPLRDDLEVAPTRSFCCLARRACVGGRGAGHCELLERHRTPETCASARNSVQPLEIAAFDCDLAWGDPAIATSRVAVQLQRLRAEPLGLMR